MTFSKAGDTDLSVCDIIAPITIYTCVIGNYDSVKLPIESWGGGFRYVYLADSPSHVPRGWEYAPLMSPRCISHPHFINRYHKFFPHLIFPESRYSIYIDGSVSYNGDIGQIVERFISSRSAIGLFRHPKRNGLESESVECAEALRFDAFDKQRVDKQLALYSAQGLPMNECISMNGFIIRDHYYPGLYNAMSLWWSQLFEYTKRDQLSLSYALWCNDLQPTFLEDLSPGCEDHLMIRKHRLQRIRSDIPSYVLRKLRLLFGHG